jgi:amidase
MDDITRDTQWLDATAQAELVAAREVKAVELADAAVERIERIDGGVNAVVLDWYDRARREAAAIDDGSSSAAAGPFAGVPFLLKDLGAPMAGETMSNGNRAMREARPIFSHDSTLVSRFRDAGLVTLGRTNSPELGSLPVTEPLAWGATRNPWDIDHTPGGSSGGAAAAVAAGMVPIAHASDGGGSIRIPAACCGLVGLKPSQGRITMGPDVDESGLGVHLCVSRSVRDTARLLDAVRGPGTGDTVIAPPAARPYTEEVGADPGRLRIGLLDSHPQGAALHDDCVTAVRSVAGMLEQLGHQVELGHPAILADADFQRRFMALWATGRAVGIDTMGAILGRPLTEEEVEPVNWAQAKFAENLSAVAYAEALAAVSQFRRELQQWWTEGWDLLLSPTLAEPPTRIGEHDALPDDPMAGMKRAARFIAFTPPFNTSGQPAINVPLHWTHDGLPIGVQLAAAYGREDLLLAVAAQLESAHPWADRRPPVS